MFGPRQTTTRKSHRASTGAVVRAACDRCHETKSRCARAPGSFECERCSRLGNVCVHSAPLTMGRPKEKVGSSGSFVRDYVVRKPGWKKHKRAAERTCDSGQTANANPHLVSPSLFIANFTDPVGLGDLIEDSQPTTDSWLPAEWPRSDFDLDITHSDLTPPLDRSDIFAESTFHHFQDTTFSTLPPGDPVSNPIGADLSDPLDLFNNNIDMVTNTLQQGPRNPSTSHSECLYQLLRLQADLHQVTACGNIPDTSSQTLFMDHVTAESSTTSAETGGVLDKALGATQTLIDILRTQHCTDVAGEISQSGRGSVDNNSAASADASDHSLDMVITLLSLSCYSSLLVTYNKLVKSLLSPAPVAGDSPHKQTLLSSPSLQLGTFSMTARSVLFASTVLHVVKQMLEQLQTTFQAKFISLSHNSSDIPASADAAICTSGQGMETWGKNGSESPIIAASFAVLADISKKEKSLMELLATKR